MTDPLFTWRGPFKNPEVHRLHADAFGTTIYSEDEWNWERLVDEHSLGWVTARIDGQLVGFTNVISDGFVHAWLQDVMVSPANQRSGLGREVVRVAAEQATAAGCEWLHVDFDEEQAGFYYEGCGFKPASAGLLYLQ